MSFRSFLIASTALTFLSSALAAGGNVLYELDNAHATVYYDMTNSLCGDASKGDPFAANWAESSGIHAGIPFCQGQTARTLDQLNTNRIVAMNSDMVIGDPAEYCGKEVQIIQADGTPLVFDEGPLFIWDACAACASASIIDLSAKAFTQLKGDTCSGNNPGGLTIKVLDNNIWEHGSGGDVSPEPAPPVVQPAPTSIPPAPTTVVSTSTSVSTAQQTSTAAQISEVTPDYPFSSSSSVNRKIASAKAQAESSVHGYSLTIEDNLVKQTNGATTSASIPSISQAVSALMPPSAAAGGGACQYGAWRCDGLRLEVCNYVSLTQLDWETIETCNTVCEITPTGSVDCE